MLAEKLMLNLNFLFKVAINYNIQPRLRVMNRSLCKFLFVNLLELYY